MKKRKSKYTFSIFKKELPLHLMLLPGVLMILVFNYTTMAGLIIAFQKFIPSKGLFGDQKWVGFDNFRYVFKLPGFSQALKNTIVIAFWKIVLGLLVPIVFALLLNEIRGRRFKKTVQTIVYLPYFLSWVVLGGIFIDMLSPSTGIVNQIIKAFGGKEIFFLGDNRYFKGTLIATDIWKNFGYGAIVYLAAIAGINPELYEAASVDGAGRFKKMWHITLPGIRSTIVVLLIMNLGNILGSGFDRPFAFQNNMVMNVANVISTFVYTNGIKSLQFSLTTAVGLFQSVICVIFLLLANWISRRLGERGIW